MVEVAEKTSVSRNKAKYQVLMCIHENSDQPYGVSARLIARDCPAVSLRYLNSRLKVWVEAGYLRRCKAPRSYSKHVYRYRLTDLGVNWFFKAVSASRRREAKVALDQEKARALAEIRQRVAKYRKLEELRQPGSVLRLNR